MGFWRRWVFPTQGMTVLSGTEAVPRSIKNLIWGSVVDGSAQHCHPEGWKHPSTTYPHIRLFFLHNATEKLKRIYVVCLVRNTRVRTEFPLLLAKDVNKTMLRLFYMAGLDLFWTSLSNISCLPFLFIQHMIKIRKSEFNI